MQKTKTLTFCALITAVLCVVSPFTIMLGTIPLTFSLFALMLCATAVGGKITAVSALCYLVLGACGLPVFSNFTGGIGVMLSFTGGFLFSYPLVALVAGIKTKYPYAMCLLSLLIAYTFGALYYMYVANISLSLAIKTAVLIFLPFDIVKAVFAGVLGKQIRKRLIKTRLLDY